MNYLEAVVQINNIVEDKFCKEIITLVFPQLINLNVLKNTNDYTKKIIAGEAQDLIQSMSQAVDSTIEEIDKPTTVRRS